MTYVASRNFAIVDEVLNTPPAGAAKLIDTLGPSQTRELLRHMAGQQNLHYFETWEIAELCLGAALAITLFVPRDTRILAAAAVLMLAIVVFVHLFVTPEIGALRRLIEFIPPDSNPTASKQFWHMHELYSALEVVKLLIGAFVTVMVLASGSRRRAAGRETERTRVRRRA